MVICAMKFLVLFNILGFINCLNLCGDWTQYKDIKCIKVLEKKATEEEGLKNCNQFEKSSTFITIHSKEEQEFLNKLLSKYNNISNNAWIGLKYKEKTYQWMDETVTNFTNWSDDAAKEDLCVQMTLTATNLGKWTDESCKKLGVVVCQKNQAFDLNSMRSRVENMEKNFETNFLKQKDDLMDEIKQQSETQIKKLTNELSSLKVGYIPIGFIYTQLPNQSLPQDLWPKSKWTEVTQQYSGLFFRVEGSGSEDFGKIQQANQSWISNSHYLGCSIKGLSFDECYHDFSSLNPGEYNNIAHSATTLVSYFYLYTTKGEVRPKNTAIKIWKRIQ